MTDKESKEEVQVDRMELAHELSQLALEMFSGKISTKDVDVTIKVPERIYNVLEKTAGQVEGGVEAVISKMASEGLANNLNEISREAIKDHIPEQPSSPKEQTSNHGQQEVDGISMMENLGLDLSGLRQSLEKLSGLGTQMEEVHKAVEDVSATIPKGPNNKDSD